MVLLKHLQPYLSPSNIAIPDFKTLNLVNKSTSRDLDMSLPSNIYTDIRRRSPNVNTAVQTSGNNSTFEIPKYSVDMDLVKSPIRPWGRKPASLLTRKAPDYFKSKAKTLRKLI
jgi:hypothetical protein